MDFSAEDYQNIRKMFWRHNEKYAWMMNTKYLIWIAVPTGIYLIFGTNIFSRLHLSFVEGLVLVAFIYSIISLYIRQNQEESYVDGFEMGFYIKEESISHQDAKKNINRLANKE